MKKYAGNYTAATGKAIKPAKGFDLFCQVTNDNAIYVCNGFVAYKMTAAEYAAIVQPIACREAGNWRISNDKTAGQSSFDIAHVFDNAVSNAKEAAPLERSPLAVPVKGEYALAYYNAGKGFTALYNAKYIDALGDDFTLRSPGALSTAVAYRNDEPFALVQPIRPTDQINRAVKAFFATDDADTSKNDALQAEVSRLQSKLAEAESSREALHERLVQRADEAEQLQARIATLEDELKTANHENAGLLERIHELEQAAQTNEPQPANETAANETQPAGQPTVPERFAELYKAAWLKLAERHDDIPHFAEIAASFDTITATQQGRDLVQMFASSRRSFCTTGDSLTATRNRAAFMIALAQYKRELAEAAAAA